MSNLIYTKKYKLVIQKLKKLRISLGLTQLHVASKLGKPQSYISKIELGERRLDITELEQISKIYKTKVTHFL
ncbi:MAG: helix-turn-helix transcriptional regulator [bacterium]|nr:MAG: helix-turn-helix transcriptional regulator [bacterium]